MEAGCYAIWGKECRCNNCIAQEAIRSRRTQNKIESTGSDFFYVLALCVEIDSVPYAPAVRKICSISCWYATGRSTSIPPPTKYMQGSK